MKRFVGLLLLLFACGCASHIRKPDGIAGPIVVEGVNVADGVDPEEAQRIASRYFDEFHGSCGGMSLSEETSRAWHFRAVVGFDATPLPDIVVLKDGSRISQKGSPIATYSMGVWRYRGRNFFNYESKG